MKEITQKRALLILIPFLIFNFQRPVQAQSWLLPLPTTFPRFFSSNPEQDKLLNDMFYRHFSALPGQQLVTPSAFSGDEQTIWREWNALTSLWVDTSINKFYSTLNKPSVYGTGWPADDRHDYNAELKIAFERTKMDSNGYVWMYGIGTSKFGNGQIGRGWPFPLPECNSDTVTGCYDTRHPITNTSFILASRLYFNWTGDVSFLRNNIARIRKAMHFLQTDLNGDRYWVIENQWPGHDGLTGHGHGIGSNWFDLLPFGWRDAYATIQHYAALKAMAEIEKGIEANPGWNIPSNPYGENSTSFTNKAETVKRIAGNYFWNDDPTTNPGPPESKTFNTGRFFGVVDKNGGLHDYGFVWLNLEAVYYGFANEKQSAAIYDWIEGKKIYPNENSIGQDIYYWRFAPRAHTKMNTNWYTWLWTDPGRWGEQLQNGGTSLHFSYFDIINRLKVRGPDNAYTRLSEILNWYKEVQNAGGYRQYYHSGWRGLQGCGTAGAIGIDCEFAESTLVPTTFLYGFLGIDAKIDGFHIKPRLPSSLSSAGVDNLFWQGNYYKITGSKEVAQSSSRWVSERKYEIVVKNGTEFIIPFGRTPSTPTPTPRPTNTPTPPKPGDITGDGKVDEADYAVLMANFGKTGDRSKGDLTGDGKINEADYAVLIANFGK